MKVIFFTKKTAKTEGIHRTCSLKCLKSRANKLEIFTWVSPLPPEAHALDTRLFISIQPVGSLLSQVPCTFLGSSLP